MGPLRGFCKIHDDNRCIENLFKLKTQKWCIIKREKEALVLAAIGKKIKPLASFFKVKKIVGMMLQYLGDVIDKPFYSIKVVKTC